VQGDFRIGKWLVHPRVNSIECDSETIHLEPKVMQVLATLASGAGEVFTREELRSAVWPDVFVGEDVLIRAISEIRRAFSDDPRSSHIIQTIPKVGYRLVAPVSPASEDSQSGMSSPASPPADSPGPSRAEVQRDAQLTTAAGRLPASGVAGPSGGRRKLAALFALVMVVATIGVLWVWRTNRRPKQTEVFSSRPLTTYPGSQLQPAFSPDGSTIAFVWLKEGERYGHIYVKQLNSEMPSRFTTGTSGELSPAWSPDGRSIAFIRHDETRSSVVVMPAVGGSEHEIYALPTPFVWEYGGLAWTGDGENLIFPQQNSPKAASALVELNLKSRNVRPITSPPQGWDGDWTPEVSPDGTKLAFVRGTERSTRDVYIMALPNGAPHPLTSDHRLIVGLAWSADSTSIIFSSNRSGSLSLWRVPAQGGEPEHIPFGSDGAYGASIAKQGGLLVYSHGSATWSILAADLNEKSPNAEAEILTSSEQDASPHVSPSGDKIAFQSWRSGSQEIWTAGMDGSNPIQLTASGHTAGSPIWSPDGRLMAFDARSDSYAHIFVIDAIGGAPRAMPRGDYNDIVPSWSADGRWLYFSSNRSGSLQMWKTPSDGSGAARQVTTAGGMVGIESQDGLWLYFTRFAEPGIWRVPTSGGPERKVFDGPPTGYQGYWTLGHGNLYSLSQRGGQFSIMRIDPETGHTQTVHILKHDATPFAGLSLTPDGKRLVFAEMARVSSNLTLVDHFQ